MYCTSCKYFKKTLKGQKGGIKGKCALKKTGIYYGSSKAACKYFLWPFEEIPKSKSPWSYIEKEEK